MKKHYVGILALGLSLSVSATESHKTYKEVGVASFYDDAFNGCITANGETFRQNQMTCAHLWLPLGTIVKVTNLKNHRSVVLRVNDRGPYIDGRMIDLSKSAAQILGFTGDGLTTVRMETMSYKEYLVLIRGESGAELKWGYGRNNLLPVENLAVSNNPLSTRDTMVLRGMNRFRLRNMETSTCRIQTRGNLGYLIFIGIFYRHEKDSAFHDERKPNTPDTEPLRFFEDHCALTWIAP